MAGTLAFASPAAGVTLYAGPGETDPAPCTSSDPCNLRSAVETNPAPDEVVVYEGDYDLGNTGLTVNSATTVHGAAGQAVPVLTSAGTPGIIVNGTMRRLELDHSGGSYGVQLDGGVAEQVHIHSTSSDFACSLVNATIRDSVCWHTGSNGKALGVLGGGFENLMSAVNVTAIATGTASYGLYVSWSSDASADLLAYNVIARGVAKDAFADGSGGAEASISLEYSNFTTSQGMNAGTVTMEGTGTNRPVTEIPLFADPAIGDFHQLAASPTINRGGPGSAPFATLGSGDLDADPRTVGAAPDIGADEFVPPPPPPAPTEGGGDESDTTPPETTFTQDPDDKTKKTTATFGFMANEPATFTCMLDGREQFKPCTSPLTVKVKKGKHSFQVQATDIAGNTDATPATDSWKVKKKKKK